MNEFSQAVLVSPNPQGNCSEDIAISRGLRGLANGRKKRRGVRDSRVLDSTVKGQSGGVVSGNQGTGDGRTVAKGKR